MTLNSGLNSQLTVSLKKRERWTYCRIFFLNRLMQYFDVNAKAVLHSRYTDIQKRPRGLIIGCCKKIFLFCSSWNDILAVSLTTLSFSNCLINTSEQEVGTGWALWWRLCLHLSFQLLLICCWLWKVFRALLELSKLGEEL